MVPVVLFEGAVVEISDEVCRSDSLLVWLALVVYGAWFFVPVCVRGTVFRAQVFVPRVSVGLPAWELLF